jgi:hypothetical protein
MDANEEFEDLQLMSMSFRATVERMEVHAVALTSLETTPGTRMVVR